MVACSASLLYLFILHSVGALSEIPLRHSMRVENASITADKLCSSARMSPLTKSDKVSRGLHVLMQTI